MSRFITPIWFLLPLLPAVDALFLSAKAPGRPINLPPEFEAGLPTQLKWPIPVEVDAPTWRERLGLPRRVISLHFFKGGGTSMCGLAQQHGEIIDFSPNKNWWSCQLAEQRCDVSSSRLGALAEGSNLTYVEASCGQGGEAGALIPGSGGTLDWRLDHKDPSWLYAVVLREPRDRAVSAWQYWIGQALKKDWNNFTQFFDWVESQPASHNEVTENILGSHRAPLFNAAPPLDAPSRGEWERRVLAEAKERLRGFDMVLILEDFDSHERDRLRALGWTSTADHSHQRLNVRRRSENWDKEWTGEKIAKWEKLARLDSEVYSFAKQLAAEQRRSFSDHGRETGAGLRM